MGERNSQNVTGFRGRSLPEAASLAGYAALIEPFDLQVPLPSRLSAISQRHHPRSTEDWRLFTPRHAPEATLAGQIQFALKWEGVQLGVLAALFRAVAAEDIAAIVRKTPTGAYARRLWFLYEWLTGQTLPIPALGKVRAVPVVDPELQFALAEGTMVARQKVINNLPGTPAFCPLARRTEKLDHYAKRQLGKRAREVAGSTHPDIIARAAAFLLLSDSKASFSIEGERPPAQRVARWGQAIGEAGSATLTLAELERLQKIVVGDARFVRLGLRTEGGFIGMRDRATQEPLPEHISARPQDLANLMEGLIAFKHRAVGGGLDPVVAAASLAFGFVYIHPFEDGNGRVHRWLIHHVLARAGFNPPGLVFPVSAAILRRVEEYRRVLESYSRQLLPLIEWRPTPAGNVVVLNETADLYRYMDATRHAEFLYECVQQTVEHDLADEVNFLRAYDAFVARVEALVDMPRAKVELLWRFLQQNQGKLSTRARTHEFAALTEAELGQVEEFYAQAWQGLSPRVKDLTEVESQRVKETPDGENGSGAEESDR
jgi:hypothetical protein